MNGSKNIIVISHSHVAQVPITHELRHLKQIRSFIYLIFCHVMSYKKVKRTCLRNTMMRWNSMSWTVQKNRQMSSVNQKSTWNVATLKLTISHQQDSLSIFLFLCHVKAFVSLILINVKMRMCYYEALTNLQLIVKPIEGILKVWLWHRFQLRRMSGNLFLHQQSI